MDKRSHQRIIGATVLVSLGVIFIPMLFDSPEFDEVTGERIIPAEPTDELVTLEIPLQLPQAPNVTSSVVVDETAPLTQTVPLSGEEVVSRVPPPPTAQQISVISAPQSAEEPEHEQPSPNPSSSDAPKLPGGWVIQLASFSIEENARALSERLRGAGYTAYIDRVSGSKGSIFRVRVGPELRQDEALRLRDQLQNEFQLDGMVVNSQP